MGAIDQALSFSSELEDDDVQALKDSIGEEENIPSDESNAEEDETVYEWESK